MLLDTANDEFMSMCQQTWRPWFNLLPCALQAVLKMLSEIGTVENIPDFIEGVKNR